jgi:hypothetical protein
MEDEEFCSAFKLRFFASLRMTEALKFRLFATLKMTIMEDALGGCIAVWTDLYICSLIIETNAVKMYPINQANGK